MVKEEEASDVLMRGEGLIWRSRGVSFDAFVRCSQSVLYDSEGGRGERRGNGVLKEGFRSECGRSD